MTTIAYRDGVLAADTLVTENGRVVGYATKIRKRGPVMWGVCGCLIHMGQFEAWVVGGMLGEPPTMETRKGAISSAMMIAGDRLLTFDEHGWDAMPLPESHAAGSGAPFALGAMAHGASAEEAVRAACGIDLYSGGDITVLRR